MAAKYLRKAICLELADLQETNNDKSLTWIEMMAAYPALNRLLECEALSASVKLTKQHWQKERLRYRARRLGACQQASNIAVDSERKSKAGCLQDIHASHVRMFPPGSGHEPRLLRTIRRQELNTGWSLLGT
jgi:hypothetical protein